MTSFQDAPDENIEQFKYSTEVAKVLVLIVRNST